VVRDLALDLPECQVTGAAHNNLGAITVKGPRGVFNILNPLKIGSLRAHVSST
jgi:hypothetical protein